MYYFAYGSNMSHRRLEARIGARKIGIGRLAGYQLRFHKVGYRDQTGKCDICQTDGADTVWGVLYEISEADKKKLDHIEGVGSGYVSKDLSIELGESTVQATGYVATDIDAALQPLDWYKEHLLRGARENGLDAAYIAMIASVPAIEDRDLERKNKELGIYAETL